MGLVKLSVTGEPKDVAALLNKIEISERQQVKADLKINGRELAQTTRDTALGKQE